MIVFKANWVETSQMVTLTSFSLSGILSVMAFIFPFTFGLNKYPDSQKLAL